MEQEGTLRVWYIINPPAEPTYYYVASPTQGAAAIDRMADAQLKQPWIEANAFGLEVFEDGEWVDWWDEEGNDVESLLRV